MPLLELKNIESHYGHVQALSGVSLHVEQGEIVTLLGANGAGKSTTLRNYSGLVAPTRGEIHFEGVADRACVARKNRPAWASRMYPKDAAFFPA